jgi:ribosomal protein L27
MIKKVNKKVIVAGDIEAAQTNELNELNKQHGANVAVQGGYPTIYKIVDGKVEYYNGERTAAKLVCWALHRKKKTVHRKKKIMGGKSRRKMQRNN